MLDTAKKIQDAPPSLGTVRPDLPAPLIELVDRAMCRDPRKRPTATRMAAARPQRLAQPPSAARRPKEQKPRLRFRTPAVGRIAAVGLAAIASGWIVATLPFFPGGLGLDRRRRRRRAHARCATVPGSRSCSPCRCSRSATSRWASRSPTPPRPPSGSR